MDLHNRHVIILAENNYQELELWYPLLRMQETGARTTVVGAKAKETYKSRLGYTVESEASADSIHAEDIDALIIPGGYAPDTMRVNSSMVNLVRSAYQKNKIVAAICHAGWMLVSANVLEGKRVTCFHTIKDDVRNAGASYSDEPVVVDGNLITSRQPGDLPQFCRAIIEALAK